MLRLVLLALITGVLTLSEVGAAEARIFEPQANWWSSGRNCVSTRTPPGRRWRALPPRTCTVTVAVERATNIVSTDILITSPAPLDLKAKWVARSA